MAIKFWSHSTLFLFFYLLVSDLDSRILQRGKFRVGQREGYEDAARLLQWVTWDGRLSPPPPISFLTEKAVLTLKDMFVFLILVQLLGKFLSVPNITCSDTSARLITLG